MEPVFLGREALAVNALIYHLEAILFHVGPLEALRKEPMKSTPAALMLLGMGPFESLGAFRLWSDSRRFPKLRQSERDMHVGIHRVQNRTCL